MSVSAEFLQALQDIVPVGAILTDFGSLERLSKDYYWYSPWLKEQLADKRADVVVQCTTEAQIVALLRLTYQHRVPITARGLGTGNYGQIVPLYGGVLLDLKPMNQILAFSNGGVIAEPGVKLSTIEQEGRQQGLELRMYPSTIGTASIGGFVAGGSGGIGSIAHGVLRDRGNLRALRLITAEAEPQILELRGPEIDQALHAYGTNGIITQVDMPLAPRVDWQQLAAGFGSWQAAHDFTWAVACATGIQKRMIAGLEQPIVAYEKPIAGYANPDLHTVLLLISPTDLPEAKLLVAEHGGEVTGEAPLYGKGSPTFSDATWNHTTLWAKKQDDALTYLQCGFTANRTGSLEQMQLLKTKFGDEFLLHSEMVRFQGNVQCWALPIIRYSTRERLQEMIDYCESIGVFVYNPHTYILEDGGHDAGNPVQLSFKHRTDPRGILNPGKMRLFQQPDLYGSPVLVE
ncbi:FAD-binding oxidoreductase [Leptolyngbya sp. FACHB-261]|uniref:FAD-binding oxidoreductase n=1 Tax=Leptolyngbya sp. FACHB-261 TaxID=2692806 RepID=UPI0016847924|nr:FAD-binding oxidoreductase [Leptolyngbya sp. FACHB-261]MBD2104189.1 FAD-binding oxidoreductase [Leptolyngbya sp. FACHB-261]